jgi:DNA-binding beta-propeller fold protein YncE
MRTRAGRRPARAACLLLLSTSACSLLLAACATHWTARTAAPSIALQWPYSPNPAKLVYERSFSGFDRHRGGGGGALHAFVYGKETGERTAFVQPVAVAAGVDGRIAVADMGRKCVHLFLPDRQTYVRIDGPKERPLVSPAGVAFDDALRLFVSDASGRVLAFDADGAYLFSLDKAGAVQLQRPTGLAWSPQRRWLYVVDTPAHLIHVYTPAGEWVRSFGGRGEGKGRFNFPTHVCWAPPGELYVTNSLGSGDLAMPKGVAVDRDGVIYVADSLFDNVQLFDRNGVFLLTLGARGTDFGEFWLPAGLFISDQNELYVCDTYNHRVQVFKITVPYAAARGQGAN